MKLIIAIIATLIIFAFTIFNAWLAKKEKKELIVYLITECILLLNIWLVIFMSKYFIFIPGIWMLLSLVMALYSVFKCKMRNAEYWTWNLVIIIVGTTFVIAANYIASYF